MDIETSVGSPQSVNTYPSFRKIPRWEKPLVVTEKIDGTNGLVGIYNLDEFIKTGLHPAGASDTIIADKLLWDQDIWIVLAGSKNRWLTEKADNHGFFRWVREKAPALLNLGPGLHYGEWWGQGIQRGYGLKEKRFSLFNVGRWNADNKPTCCHIVPVLGTTSPLSVHNYLNDLRGSGSLAAPGFKNPEGIMLYHTGSKSYFKYPLDPEPKSGKQ